MKKPRFKLSDIVFVVLITLLLIPQTRMLLQVGVNKAKVAVWSPSAEKVEDEIRVTPFTYSVTDLNGESKSIAVGNGKITFLSYWATWCPPCIAELPGIQELYLDYGHEINFILLTQENMEVVQRFMKKKGYDLPVFIPRMSTPELLKENSVPTNYIIDAQGKIRVKETGAADWNSKKIRKLLDELLSN